VNVAGTLVDVGMDVALDVGLASGVGVIDVLHDTNNKNTTSWDSFFIMRLYSLSEHGHSQREHAHGLHSPVSIFKSYDDQIQEEYLLEQYDQKNQREQNAKDYQFAL